MIVNVPITHNVSALNDNMNKGLWIIWFYADWCGHCKNYLPEWDMMCKKVAMKHPNLDVKLVKVDCVLVKGNEQSVILTGLLKPIVIR